MNEAVLAELKKMNAYLEAIDWKLWNFHKKYVELAVTVDDVRRQLAETTPAPVTPVTVAPIPVAVSEPAPQPIALAEKQDPAEIDRQEYEYDLDIKPVNKVLTPVVEQKDDKTLVIPKYPTVEKI